MCDVIFPSFFFGMICCDVIHQGGPPTIFQEHGLVGRALRTADGDPVFLLWAHALILEDVTLVSGHTSEKLYHKLEAE